MKDKEKMELPFIDGVPNIPNQQRITWIVNGESNTGSNSVYRAEGTLNRVSWQLYQNIIFIKNMFDRRDEIFNSAVVKMGQYDETIKNTEENVERVENEVFSLSNDVETLKQYKIESEGNIGNNTTDITALEERADSLEQNLYPFVTSTTEHMERTNERLDMLESDNSLEEFKGEVYSKEEVNQKFVDLPPIIDAYSKVEIDSKINDYYTKEETYSKEEVNERINNIPKPVESYSKQQIDEKFSQLPEPIDSYTKEETYSKIEVDGKFGVLPKPIDSYTKEETYSKIEVDTKISELPKPVDSYTKEETYSQFEVDSKFSQLPEPVDSYSKEESNAIYTPKSEMVKYYVKGEIDNKFNELPKPVDAYTKEESDLRYAVLSDLSSKATKDEVEVLRSSLQEALARIKVLEEANTGEGL